MHSSPCLSFLCINRPVLYSLTRFVLRSWESISTHSVVVQSCGISDTTSLFPPSGRVNICNWDVPFQSVTSTLKLLNCVTSPWWTRPVSHKQVHLSSSQPSNTQEVYSSFSLFLEELPCSSGSHLSQEPFLSLEKLKSSGWRACPNRNWAVDCHRESQHMEH